MELFDPAEEYYSSKSLVFSTLWRDSDPLPDVLINGRRRVTPDFYAALLLLRVNPAFDAYEKGNLSKENMKEIEKRWNELDRWAVRRYGPKLLDEAIIRRLER